MIDLEDGDANEYYDDPSVAPAKRKFLGPIFAILVLLAGGLFVKTTLAANITLNSVNATEFGQGVAFTTACSGANQITLTPSSTFSNSSSAGTFYFNKVTVSGIPSSCYGSDFTINAYNNGSSTPLALYNGSSTNILVLDNNGTFYGSLSEIGLTVATNSSSSFSAIFNSPVAASTTTYKLTIQSGPNTITLSCTQTATQCTWTTQTSAGSPTWNAIATSSDGTHLAAAVYSGDIFTSSNSGQTWTDHAFGANYYWEAIASNSSGSEIVAVGQGSAGVQISTDYGSTWNAMSLSCSLPLSVGVSSDGTHIVVGCGNGGNVAYTANSGSTWNYWAPPVQWAAWVAVSADGTHIAVATGQQGGNRTGPIYTSSNFGASFITQTSSGNHYWRGISESGDGSRIVATAYDAGLFTSSDGGSTWSNPSGAFGGNSGAVISSSGSTIAAVIPNSGLYISNDFGVNFTAQTALNGLNFAGYQPGICITPDGSKIATVVSAGAIYTGQ